MMKTLTLLRHGKSDWHADFGQDHERPINRRGRDSARAVGRFLRRTGLVPDAVVTSTAVRARTTVELAAEAGAWTCPILQERELYDSHPEAVLQVLQRQEDAHGHLLLAGHQPTWSHMAGQLIGGGRLHVVTATLVHVELAATRWADVAWGRGQLLWMLPPRLLIGGGLDDP